MTKEEKQLLLKDLCARLPYGVKCNAVLKQIDGSLKSIFGTFKGYNGWATVNYDLVDIETVRPYLRPLSSMTEEEENEYRTLNCYEGLFPRNEEALDYVLEHHFDYRGLIEKGLAFEAQEGIYVMK